MSKSRLTLNLNEQNELAFKISIEGSTSDLKSTKPNIRFIVSETVFENEKNAVSWIYPTEKDDDGFIVVNIPDNEFFSEEKIYEGKLEVILGNHYFVPTEVELEFIKPLRVEAVVMSSTKKPLQEENTKTASVVEISSVHVRNAVKPLPPPNKIVEPKNRTWDMLSKSEQTQVINYRKQKILEENNAKKKIADEAVDFKEHLKNIFRDSLKN
jgi:hypothetical protein